MLNADDPLVMRMPVPAGVTKVRMSHIVLFFYQMNYQTLFYSNCNRMLMISKLNT